MGTFNGNGCWKEADCPICGKHFIVPLENIYKVDGKDLCRYNCFVKAKKLHEEEKSSNNVRRGKKIQDTMLQKGRKKKNEKSV